MRWPDAAAERELCARLCAFDLDVGNALWDAYSDPLIRTFHAQFPALLDDTIIVDAVIDSLLRLPENPTRYDPGRMTLRNYLCMDVSGDIRNKLQQEQRRLRRFFPRKCRRNAPGAE